MVIREIARLLEAEVLVGADKLDQEVDMAFSSDMMSDVLAYVTGSTVLLTGLVNEHVIRTAEMVDLECIVFVRGKKPTSDIIEMAEEARDVVVDPYCEKLTALTELYLDEIDHTIEENLRGWSLRRLSKMTLTILRVAVCEMQFMRADDVPVSVSINEAVELAKIYGNEKDASYVNGVLSTIAKKLEGAKNETESENA